MTLHTLAAVTDPGLKSLSLPLSPLVSDSVFGGRDVKLASSMSATAVATFESRKTAMFGLQLSHY